MAYREQHSIPHIGWRMIRVLARQGEIRRHAVQSHRTSVKAMRGHADELRGAPRMCHVDGFGLHRDVVNHKAGVFQKLDCELVRRNMIYSSHGRISSSNGREYSLYCCDEFL